MIIETPDGERIHEWYRKGRLHREDGPAKIIERNTEEEELRERTEVYFRHGRCHREDGPAEIRQLSTGRTERFWVDGQLRAGDGDEPSAIVTEPDGSRIERWESHDPSEDQCDLHREDGPAKITTRPDGTVISEYWRHGELRRIPRQFDGEAATVIEKRPDGTIIREYDTGNGVLHNPHGPARVEERKDGSGVEEYWEEGTLISRYAYGPAENSPRKP